MGWRRPGHGDDHAAVRAIWKGAVSFGLVNVPVRVAAATGTQNIKFHQVHAEDGGRIKYQRVCSIDGEEVPYKDISKGYETDDGAFVVLTDEDMAALPLSSSREIDVLHFVPAEQVDPILFDSSYYLQPDSAAAKPYALLREALSQSNLLAVVKVALRQRESLAVLRVRDDIICLHTLLWPDEVRQPDFEVLPGGEGLRPQELAMAASLVESMTSDFDPDEFTDGYTAAVHELIEAKISSGDVTQPVAPPSEEGAGDAQVLDLLTALQRSVDRRTGAGSDGPATSPADDGPAAEQAPADGATAPARKTAKAPAKAAAGRTPAKKAATAPAKKAAATRAPAKKTATKTPAKKAAATEAPTKKAATKAPPKKAATKTPGRRSA